MRQGALPRREHDTGGRQSPSSRSARARNRSAGGGAHPPRPGRAPARPLTLSAGGQASRVRGDSSLGSLLPPDPPQKATVNVSGFFPPWVLEPPVPSCAGSQLPAASAVTAAARPLERPSRQLPPGDVPSCVRVCVSKRISSPPSLGRAGGTRSPATSCRVAASPHPPGSLPTHPAPTPPRSLPPLPAPPPAAAPQLPKAVGKPQLKGRRRVGKEAQVSSAQR